MADIIPPRQDLPFIHHPIGEVMVVEFKEPSLMDPVVLDAASKKLLALVDDEDRRKIILDFEKVQYLSSQAIGILLTMKKTLDALPNSKLILCGIGSRLAELLRITRLDKVLIIKPTQKEALAQFL
jgi:anti-sigma B factor antagonist